jgi:hypothetical protein
MAGRPGADVKSMPDPVMRALTRSGDTCTHRGTKTSWSPLRTQWSFWELTRTKQMFGLDYPAGGATGRPPS